MRRAPGIVAAALAVVLTAGCASGSGDAGAVAEMSGMDGHEWRGTVVRSGYPLPSQRFTDTNGDTVVPARDADAPVTLVFFGYTHCPDICNVVLANIASALRGSTPEVREATRLLFVSTDPARDTPSVVREYLGRFDPSYVGLVAPEPTVARAARALHLSYERPDGGSGGAYGVAHSAYTTAFAGGRARLVWSEETPVADLRADLAMLAGQHS